MPVAFVTGATTGFVPVTVYEIPAPGAGAVTVIVPVETVHVGCAVTVAVGAAGGVGTALTVRGVAIDTHVISAVFLTVMLWPPGTARVNVTDVWKSPPSRLYSNPAPRGADTVIVPVGTVHVGCAVTLAVGAAGATGTSLTVNEVAVDTHPVFVVVTS